ncbi:unnamed protein product [Caenorhabditis angaria]|uniref:Uncharacterized protein n=1 Tax=Caenorhabditis angaria TaxID=860376 RepID=A0A9P1J030_9PELO|nr:unnamed protein product [Caenorhabditis angaria]
MEPEFLGQGYGSFEELYDTHHSVILDGKVVLIGQKYVDQKAHNWGHRIAYAGTYLLTFDPETKEWTKKEFDQLSDKENYNEIIFTANNKLFILLVTNFGAIHFERLFEWTGSSWFELAMQRNVEKVEQDPAMNVYCYHMPGTTSDGKSVFVFTDQDGAYQVYTLDTQTMQVDHAHTVSAENNHMRGKVITGAVHGNKALLSIGVSQCAFRWQNQTFTLVNLETNTSEEINIEGEWTTLPRYCYSGPSAVTVNPETGSWILAAGVLQVGMCDSEYYGAVWALKNAFESAGNEWKEVPGTVPEGITIADGVNIYTVTKEQVTKIILESDL